MGPPMDEERMQRMMEDPNVQQTMNEALNNPDFVNMLIQSNPMLRNMPNAREIVSSPFMRQMMSNPAMITQAMRMQRNMRGGNSAFPAPGATDTTPSDAPSTNESGAGAGANPGQNQDNPFANPFLSGLNPMAGAGGLGGQDPEQMAQQLQAMMGALGGGARSNPTGQTDASATTGQGDSQQQNQAPANPFAALFGPQGGAGAGAGAGGAQGGPGDFASQLQQMGQLMQMMGGPQGGGESAAPPDNRPPEERYEDQLRQLNDMGFYDFDRNVAALRRSGGSVQGAVEYLLTATD